VGRIEKYQEGRGPDWSRFGVLPEPESWTSVLTRMPRLPERHGRFHMSILQKGSWAPYSANSLRRWMSVPNWMTIDVVGSPNSGKSLLLEDTLTERIFRPLGITYAIYPEIPAKSLPVLYNEEDTDAILSAHAAARLMTNTSLLADGGKIDRIAKFQLYEKGLFGAVGFEQANRLAGGGPPRHNLYDIIAPHTWMINAIVNLHVPVSESLRRGCSMSREYLEEVERGHQGLPTTVAHFAERSGRPIIYMNIDATDPPVIVAEKVACSLGTILFDIRRNFS